MNGQNWEYLVLTVDCDQVIKAGNQDLGSSWKGTAPGLQEYLAERGREGWEVACSTSDGNGHSTMTLKRPATIGAPLAGTVTKEAGS